MASKQEMLCPSEGIKMLVAFGAALVLVWMSMHLLLVCLGLGITVGEMRGHAAETILAHLGRAANLALVAATAVQLLTGWALGVVLSYTVRPMHSIARFSIGFAFGVGLSLVLVLIALSTGGAMVVPSLEHALSSAIQRI